MEEPIELDNLPTNVNKTYDWKVPGAKYIRLVIKEYQLQLGSLAFLRNPKDKTEFQSVKGIGKNLSSKFIKSDEIGVRLLTDGNPYGKLVIEKIQYTK